MRRAWPYQRENDPDRHCVATVLPHNAMFSLTFAGVASVDLLEPPFCNVLSFAVFRRYSAACHTTSYSGENGLVWYGPHDLIVGHAGGGGMIFVRCSRSGSGENGDIFRLVACRVLRLTPRKDLSCWQRRSRRAMVAAGCGGAQSALTDSRKPTEAVAGFHARRCRAMEAVVRYGSHVGFAGSATAGRADYGQEHQGRQGPSAAGCGRTGRHAVVRHARRRPLRESDHTVVSQRDQHNLVGVGGVATGQLECECRGDRIHDVLRDMPLIELAPCTRLDFGLLHEPLRFDGNNAGRHVLHYMPLPQRRPFVNQAIILAICRCSASRHSPAVMMR